MAHCHHSEDTASYKCSQATYTWARRIHRSDSCKHLFSCQETKTRRKISAQFGNTRLCNNSLHYFPIRYKHCFRSEVIFSALLSSSTNNLWTAPPDNERLRTRNKIYSFFQYRVSSERPSAKRWRSEWATRRTKKQQRRQQMVSLSH